MTFTKLPKAISAEELLSTPLPPVKWIIPGLLPAGLALFAGPSKAGKSWLTLWLCLQIAQGNPVWDREIEPRTVIYFSLEDTFNRLQSRIFQLIDGGDAPERLILQTECPSIGQGLPDAIWTIERCICGRKIASGLWKMKKPQRNEKSRLCRTTCGKQLSTSKALGTGREPHLNCLRQQVLKMPNRTSSPTTWRSISIKYLNRKTSDIKPIEKTRFAF